MKDLTTAIREAIDAELASRGLDARRCFTDVTAAPPDGRLRVEATDADLLAAVRARVGDGAEKVTWRSLPQEGDSLPAGLIGASSVADVRRTPEHTAELVTQLIYGDAVEPLKDNGEWYLVRMDDGYIGWVRAWHLAEVSPERTRAYRERAQARVASNHAEVFEAASEESLPVTDLVVGTVVAANDSETIGWSGVELPDGKTGFVKSRALEALPPPGPPSRDRLSAIGLRFLGIPYIWGGTTPKGFDCSGLIQRIFRLGGVLIPRDADLQSAFGALRPHDRTESLDTGDLLFFGAEENRITHVAMMLSDGLILHAYGQVRVASLDPRHPLYDGKLHRDWRISRAPLSS